jgi:hypothetical protein
MQLLLQEQNSNAAASTAQDADSAHQETQVPVYAADSSGVGSAVAAAASSGVAGRHGSGDRGGECDALLLLYMRAWFSMLAGLLGVDMLRFFHGVV